MTERCQDLERSPLPRTAALAAMANTATPHRSILLVRVRRIMLRLFGFRSCEVMHSTLRMMRAGHGGPGTTAWVELGTPFTGPSYRSSIGGRIEGVCSGRR